MITGLRILLLIGVLVGVASSQESPRDTLEHFCEMDSQGKQLSLEGWREIAQMFVAPGLARRSDIIVIKDFVVSRAKISGSVAKLYVEYIYLGQISPGPRFERPAGNFPSGPSKVRIEYELSLDEKSAAGASDTTSAEASVRRLWKIQGSPPEPHVTIETGIQYLEDLREKAHDEETKRNADNALSALKRQR